MINGKIGLLYHKINDTYIQTSGMFIWKGNYTKDKQCIITCSKYWCDESFKESLMQPVYLRLYLDENGLESKEYYEAYGIVDIDSIDYQDCNNIKDGTIKIVCDQIKFIC